jgi:hypothetical protein
MSRTLAAVILTMGVVVPAALDANIEVDGKKLRPHQQSFTVDGTRVTLDVDRGLAMTGDKITATLVAFSDTPKRVAIDVRLVQTHLQPGERVSPPERQIDREKITLDATPEGKPAKVQLVLGTPRKAMGQEDRFQIYISPHGDRPPTTGDDYGDRSTDWQANVEAGHAAVVDVIGWSGNSISMKVSTQGPIVAKQPFVVAVHVKNTTGRVLPAPPSVEVLTVVDLGGHFDPTAKDEDVTVEALDDANADDNADHHVKRGVDTVRMFRVTPLKGQTEITLGFSALALDDDIGPILGGAKDAITFRVGEGSPTIAAK